MAKAIINASIHRRHSMPGINSELERILAEWIGVRFAIGVASGTIGLYIALRAAGVKSGDEVIVSAYDWYAATAAVLHLDGIPIFSDVEPLTYTIDPNSVEKLISSKTKAIIATHLFGNPCDMDMLQKLANNHKIILIEDCSQALGAIYKNKKVGSIGDIACFSFGIGKIISGLEGGMIVTNNEAFYEQILRLSQHPFRQKLAGLKENPFALKNQLHPRAANMILDEWTSLEEKHIQRREAFKRLNEILAETDILNPIVVQEGCIHAIYKYCPTINQEHLKDLTCLRIVNTLIESGLPACQGFIPEPIPVTLGRTLKLGYFSWHSFPKRIEQACRQTCPISQKLCNILIELDWQIGLSSLSLKRLSDVLKKLSKAKKLISTKDCKQCS